MTEGLGAAARHKKSGSGLVTCDKEDLVNTKAIIIVALMPVVKALKVLVRNTLLVFVEESKRRSAHLGAEAGHAGKASALFRCKEYWRVWSTTRFLCLRKKMKGQAMV
ncbi:hypothetical protein [Pseudalkalibacillus decolorationis]|uniref:hypothetical protein n=1 Tax=Pseudalkalibacillus decolorationis TaxID=163879 RepID=UPI002148DB0F|nr:hypothetical protein [Pseudalkalibacillus decolorationis]